MPVKRINPKVNPNKIAGKVPAMQLVLLGIVMMLGGCGQAFPQSHTVCVTGYNEFDKKIHEFWLDNKNKSGCFGTPGGRDKDWGAYGGGGGFACGCTVTPGEKVTLEWAFVQTLSEYKSGAPEKWHEARVVIPQPESSSSRYLRVYFKRDGTNPIQWVDNDSTAPLPPSKEEVDGR